MQIVCPTCATAYEVDPASLGDEGRTVRCGQCGELWFAARRQPEPAVAAVAPSMWDEPPEAGPSEPEHPAAGDRLDRSEIEFAAPGDIATVAEAPPTVPDGEEAQPADADDGIPDYVEARRRRVRRHAAKARSSVPMPWVAAVLAGIVLALVYERAPIVRAMPQMASLYSAIGLSVNLRGLVFEDVKTLADQQDGVPVLVMEGAIRNVTKEPVEVPRLRFALRNDAGVEIYTWTAQPERTVLAPGEREKFRTRLASPPAGSKTAHVRFFQRRDLAAATH